MKRHTFCGRRYRILDTDPDILARMVQDERARTKNEEPERLYGLTDSPDTKRKAIRIARSQSDAQRLETEIHEALHACDWNAAEDWVTQAAHDVAAFLLRRGWRPA